MVLHMMQPQGTLMSQNPRYQGVHVGAFTYGVPELLFWSDACSIGKFCSIAVGVKLFGGGEHDYRNVTTYPFQVMFSETSGVAVSHSAKGPLRIGNDVWIGRDAMILSGVTVGDGAVVGAGAVVAHDVPPYAIVAGNPAKVIRYRFSETIIQQLEEIRWWDWPVDRIIENVPYLLSNQIELFLERAAAEPHGEAVTVRHEVRE